MDQTQRDLSSGGRSRSGGLCGVGLVGCSLTPNYTAVRAGVLKVELYRAVLPFECERS